MISKTSIYKLVQNGVPIKQDLIINLNEKDFVKTVNTLINQEDNIKIKNDSEKRFTGGFQPGSARKLILRPRKILMLRNAITDSILINGSYEPTSDSRTKFSFEISQSDSQKRGLKTLKISLIGIIIILIFKMFSGLGLIDFIFAAIFLLLFYFSALLISISQTKGQIDLFKEFFLNQILK